MEIRYLILVLTTRCNLNCSYCYGGFGQLGIDMPDDVLDRALAMTAEGKGPCHVQITGGEPTLVPEKIERVARWIQRRQRPLTLAIQTNGTRLTPDLTALFKTHRIQVGVSRMARRRSTRRYGDKRRRPCGACRCSKRMACSFG
jgi:uncharacterized protein